MQITFSLAAMTLTRGLAPSALAQAGGFRHGSCAGTGLALAPRRRRSRLGADRTCKLLALTAAVSAELLVATPSLAAQIAGVTLPSTETVDGRRLRLKACAVREELWTNLYAVSLYLPQQTAAAQVVTAQSPKLVRIDVTYGGEVPNGLPAEWKQGLQHHVSQEFLQTLQGLYNDLKSGDTVRVSYSPKSGTSLSVNGRDVASRPGDAVFNAMMRLWVGPNPVSQNIKRLLLEGRC